MFARYQEVYAAVVDNVDQNLGRLLGTLDALGELDNTIVIFTSDNGGTGEGGVRGTRSYFAQLTHMYGLRRDWRRDIDLDPSLIGGLVVKMGSRMVDASVRTKLNSIRLAMKEAR